MKWLRAGGRLGLVALATGFHLAILLGGLLLMLPLPRARARWRSVIFYRWCRSLLPVLGVAVTVRGEPPRRPFLLVCNHLSYLDVLVLGSQAGAVFVAKSEIAGWPIIGFLCHSVNTIFIDRSLRRDLPRVMREIDREMELGNGVVLFAEGTSSKGATVLPFRPSLLESAARARLPVAFAALSYHTHQADAPAHLAVCWWGGMPFSPHLLNFATLRRVDATVVFGERPIQGSDRKRLAEELHAAVLERFDPVVGEED